MDELTVGDIRPLLALIENNPLLDDSAGLASQLRSIIIIIINYNIINTITRYV